MWFGVWGLQFGSPFRLSAPLNLVQLIWESEVTACLNGMPLTDTLIGNASHLLKGSLGRATAERSERERTVTDGLG